MRTIGQTPLRVHRVDMADDAGSRTNLAKLRALIQRAEPWAKAARAVGLTKTTARRQLIKFDPQFVRRGRRRRAPRRLTPAERARLRSEIDEALLSFRALARKYRRSPDTVSRLARAAIDEECEELELRTRTLRTAVVCPTCGHKVEIVPCVACAARRSRTG